jgi:pimeloyl-ACP methyl ester carboxylesterase
MVAQARANLRGRGRWLITPVIATLVMSAIGGGLATLAGVAGRSDPPQAGKLIDVGGRQLYIECHGTGSPVVILQAGLNGSAADWSRIAPGVAESTTVCAYDRAGHGWSDPAAGPQDGTAIATDLHVLLDRAGIAGPYVLVGHSSGGPYMRVFATRYADEVAGMALLDAQPADAFTALPDYPSFYEPYRAALTLAPSLARVGVGILALGSPSDPAGVRTARSMRDEVMALPAALEQARALTTIGMRPLVVVSAGSGSQAGWSTAQERMAHLSGNVAHRVIPTATHESVLVGADASASSRAILEVVSSVRTARPVQ